MLQGGQSICVSQTRIIHASKAYRLVLDYTLLPLLPNARRILYFPIYNIDEFILEAY